MVSVAVVFLVTATVNAQSTSTGAPVMVPGLWEITTQTRSPQPGPPITHSVCIDKDHVTRPDPPRTKKIDDCQVFPDAAAANETAYTVRCTKRKIITSSRFAYSGDHFEGTVNMKSPDGEVQQIYTAKRVGDCEDPSTPATSTAH
jgi:hypothetical protein